jgi:hypothetical protein
MDNRAQFMNYLSFLLVSAALLLAGCNKSSSSTATAGEPMAVVPNFHKAFPSPPPEVAASIEKIVSGVRYRQYQEALPELEKLAANPSLTPGQKKAVDGLLDRVKKAMATPPA